MEEQRDPIAIAELDKKKCRPNTTATLIIGGFIVAVGGIGVAATSTGTLPIIFGTIAASGGVITTVVSYCKDTSYLKKCFCCVSNKDNLDMQINAVEVKTCKKLINCLQWANQMRNGTVDINIEYLETICNAVKFFGGETSIACQIKDSLLAILMNNLQLLNDVSLKNTIPEAVRSKAQIQLAEQQRAQQFNLLNQQQAQPFLLNQQRAQLQRRNSL